MTIIRAGQTLHAHGTLAASEYLTIDGSTGSAPGAAVVVSGHVVNDGFVVIQGSAYPGAASATIVSGGVLTNNGDIIIGLGNESATGVGPAIQIDGTLDNQNLIRFGEGYPGAPDTMTIAAGGGLLDNAGVFYLTGGRLGGGATGVGVTLNDAGVLSNSGSMIVCGGNAGSAYPNFGAQLNVTGSLTNTGQLDMRGCYYGSLSTSGTLDLSGQMSNAGDVIIHAASSYGSDDGASGALLDVLASGYLTNTAAISIGGSGGGGTPPSGTLAVTGRLLSTGAIAIDGGGGSSDAYGGEGGVLSTTGVLTNAGTITVAGGGGLGQTSSGAGGAILAGGFFYNGGGFPNHAVIDLQAGLPGLPGTGSVLIATGFFDNQGTVEIGQGSAMTVTNTGELFDEGTIQGAGTLVNEGRMLFDGDTAVAAAHMVNDGSVSLLLEHVTFDGAITADPGQSGVFTLDSLSTLTFESAVSSGESVVFTGRAPLVLALGNAIAFAGTLDGLGSAATLDFLGLDVTGASTAGNALTLDIAGGVTFDLALNQPLAAGTGFILASDGHGGTDLGFTPPAAPILGAPHPT